MVPFSLHVTQVHQTFCAKQISASLTYKQPFFSLFSSFSTQGLLSPNQEDAVNNCIGKLDHLLICATKKRPDGPPSILGGSSLGFEDAEIAERKKLKTFLAEQLAKQLVLRGMKNIDDYDLHHIVYEIAQKTALDDGTLATPPKHRPAPPPMPAPPQEYYGYPPGYQGYQPHNSGPPP